MSERMNFLERAIQVVSPRWAFNRGYTRAAIEYFGYDSANPGTLRGGSGGQSRNASSESPKMQADTVKVMWDARDATRNNSLLGGILRRDVRYCFDKIAYKSTTGDRQVDKLLEDYFHDCCTRIDLTQRHSLKRMMRQAWFQMKRDGDFGFNRMRVPVNGRKMEVRLQSIEADRIGNPLDAGRPLDQFYIRGITIDPATGAPVSYRIYKRNRLGLQYTFDQEIPGSNFVHLMNPDESDKYRPPSWLQPVLGDARDLNEIWGFVKQRCKFTSQFSGFFKPTDPRGPGGLSTWDNAENKATNTPASMNAVSGKVVQLPAGQGDVTFPPSMNEPAGSFMNLWETGIRKIANALDRPYGYIWDMAVFGGVTARLETMSADRCFRDDRELATDLFLRDLKNEILALGISNRDIPAHPNFRNGQFHFGARLTADVGTQTSALTAAIDAGLTSKTRVQEEWFDEDFDDLTETQASEILHRQEVAGRTGVPIELLDKSNPNATQLLAAINTPPPVPPPGMVPQGTDVKALLEILAQVGKGELDRESAVETIVQLYGISREDADLMVPEPKDLPSLKIAAKVANKKPSKVDAAE